MSAVETSGSHISPNEQMIRTKCDNTYRCPKERREDHLQLSKDISEEVTHSSASFGSTLHNNITHFQSIDNHWDLPMDTTGKRGESTANKSFPYLPNGQIIGTGVRVSYQRAESVKLAVPARVKQGHLSGGLPHHPRHLVVIPNPVSNRSFHWFEGRLVWEYATKDRRAFKLAEARASQWWSPIIRINLIAILRRKSFFVKKFLTICENLRKYVKNEFYCWLEICFHLSLKAKTSSQSSSNYDSIKTQFNWFHFNYKHLLNL